MPRDPVQIATNVIDNTVLNKNTALLISTTCKDEHMGGNVEYLIEHTGDGYYTIEKIYEQYPRGSHARSVEKYKTATKEFITKLVDNAYGSIRKIIKLELIKPRPPKTVIQTLYLNTPRSHWRTLKTATQIAGPVYWNSVRNIAVREGHPTKERKRLREEMPELFQRRVKKTIPRISAFGKSLTRLQQDLKKIL